MADGDKALSYATTSFELAAFFAVNGLTPIQIQVHQNGAEKKAWFLYETTAKMKALRRQYPSSSEARYAHAMHDMRQMGFDAITSSQQHKGEEDDG